MAKSKGVTLAGIRFRPGEVDWEDARSEMRKPLPDFEKLKQGEDASGTTITSAGLVAKVGRYLVVVTEKDQELKEFDYTLIPLHAKKEIRYT